ncbi:putative preprotein translocase SecE subunit [Actinoplanes missouriensis 431]|uniref:Protein translocase subunit SecE n=1 Tax=Actinoplanes missouriensis (strain ATCC 14538 / DSM 43046 / CBS 188.64 / JCM 3121 / NBRC 102363 / NCIMB 12654 / NRRL B-3342 / UNCC 431) TaxID=512565 RepID=I0GYH0_ACTM4|nr:preprotein translocase subunit SecE [Actinoplanes missouriensis]BAL85807.1 putative preprotein translocase SecE subunit [Actinoplanes missouriensis 431]
MAEKDRPGDDVPGDDEVLADAAAGGGVPDDGADTATGSGGTALAERSADSDSPKAKKRRGGPIGRVGGFFREVVSELRKVIWPTRKELLTYTSVVIVFVTVVTAIVSGLDYAFGKGILWALG